MSSKYSDVIAFLASLPPNSQPCIVGTLVLGANPEHSALARDIYRVLKPGGRYFFVERTSAGNGLFRAVQTLISPLSRLLNLGVDPSANIAKSIVSAGFEQIYIEQWPHNMVRGEHRQGITLLTASPAEGEEGFDGISGWRPLVAGVAVKSGDVSQDYDPFAFGSALTRKRQSR